MPTDSGYPILYVDDEPENLRVFELTFRREFEVLTAESGEGGLEIINSRPVAVVLSDHKMPGMTGAEFLGRVRDLAPETIRMLVTAYGSADTLAHAINDGSIYRYVAKPWDAEEMRVAIRRGIELFALQREREGLINNLQAVNEIARTITRELSLEPLLDLLVSALTDQLGYDGASISLFDPSGDRLKVERMAPHGDAVSASLHEFSLERHEAPELFDTWAAGEARFLSVADCFDEPLKVQTWLTELAADVLAVPILGKNKPIGVLALDNRSGGGVLGASDRTVVEGIAQQAAVAIRNARLVEDLRRTRNHVLRADRLGTLGTLTAGFAHEINNPLTSIHTFLSLAQAKRKENDENFWGDYHRLACSEVERIRDLVATMARLGRDDGHRKHARAKCSLQNIVEEVITLVAPEAERRNVQIELRADGATPKIMASRPQLHQLMMNLLLNALHASTPGGSIDVVIESGGPSRNPGASVSVIDGGAGIEEEDLERIFDPFFTTKGPDQGTGLGLMICHRIVTEHGGLIEVSSGLERGSTFCVRLPSQEGLTGHDLEL